MPFVWRVGAAVTVTGASPGMALYPNPAVSVVWVRLNDPSCVGSVLQVYNQLGQRVMAIRVTSLVFQLDVSALGQGIYFVRAGSGGAGKLVKM